MIYLVPTEYIYIYIYIYKIYILILLISLYNVFCFYYQIFINLEKPEAGHVCVYVLFINKI